MKTNKQIATHYNWGKKCDSWIFCNSQNLSVKLEKMPAYTSEVRHKHLFKEQYFFVLHGEASLSCNGTKTILRKNEGIAVSKGQLHYITNQSDKPVEFLVVSTPNMEEDRINFDDL